MIWPNKRLCQNLLETSSNMHEQIGTKVVIAKWGHKLTHKANIQTYAPAL